MYLTWPAVLRISVYFIHGLAKAPTCGKGANMWRNSIIEHHNPPASPRITPLQWVRRLSSCKLLLLPGDVLGAE